LLAKSIAPGPSTEFEQDQNCPSARIETCSECGGVVKIIASIEDPAMINKILAHLDEKAVHAGLNLLPECWAPPGCLEPRARRT
jgi:hypothetical protein